MSALVPIASTTHQPVRVGDGRNLSDGTTQTLSTLFTHELLRPADSIRLVFANWYNTDGDSLPGTDPIRVRAEVRAGGILPVTFDGRDHVRIEPGETVLSDPVPLDPHGGVGTDRMRLSTCTVVSVARGGRFPLGSSTDASSGEGVAVGDLRGRAVPTASVYGYGPWQLLAEGPTAGSLLLVVGDSNGVGFGDRRGGAEHFGWVRRRFDGRSDVMNISVSGARLENSMTPAQLALRLAQVQWSLPTTVITALGTNDIRCGGPGVEEVRERMLNHWGVLATVAPHLIATTVPPATTSIDGWHTLEGQRLDHGNATRLIINDWLRTVPAPLDAVFDLAAAVEAEPGLWRPRLTEDGVHPSPEGHAAIAEAAREFVFEAAGVEESRQLT